ncbi:MAG: 2-oxoglutarate dehydrogenase complex dihydrolipoyllysine-residue succinyltransferase [Chitinivibrionales bacterium]|nr:2-oxoglutarate dehydrogenase complex dihydrolipoyllysine-residue succinyltransferase [Chitinivibrionales bacterium]
MMSTNIAVPSVGESITGGMLTTWLKGDGEYVTEGDEIFELETEKTSMNIPAPVSGVLKRTVDEGSEVETGQVVGEIDESAPAAPGRDAHPKTDEAPASPASHDALSPAVRRVVDEHQLNPAAIEGTGKDGRITKADALDAVNRNSAASAPQPAAQPSPAPVPARQPAASREERDEDVVKMTMIRKKTAARLIEARRNAAHLTTFNEIDMHKVMAIRSEHKDDFEKEHGIRIGFMSFFVKACCQALKTFPPVNAMIEGDDVHYHHYYDIGVAISLERGLIVPVIRDADKLSFAGIENAISSLARRAKDKSLTPQELTGGTFTITNGGVFGSLLSTPIPAYPQVAILGMHTIKKRPVVVDDEIVIRPMMYVALTYDHRIIDGRDAIGFLNKVKEFIEDPDKLLLEM